MLRLTPGKGAEARVGGSEGLDRIGSSSERPNEGLDRGHRSNEGVLSPSEYHAHHDDEVVVDDNEVDDDDDDDVVPDADDDASSSPSYSFQCDAYFYALSSLRPSAVQGASRPNTPSERSHTYHDR